ncbi:hypothetical protein [Umezakia ovalisporum]|jgi:hypothetical protein|uniref:Uncharacterized protein n=2 Tax=Umezakia ovalisporum TaxID=75695 RepID=A0AA43KFT6_9CYAN|nr:hypothetical protein [Umezakia ovalisporum]MDH6057383.1 hypothetical protein [Umezakia ovalisporum FSS-43]MDH6064560.1 hypothetical protein [Umezakia ovalisporum FSS-62]MDH6065895.1 hypothetical protein [Umezakia ovalisporum APH033B]MDH6070773.1 hypothetical protein [Umezakia ovalisporum CobakiLakeA]MDH6075542.1 hypothetical protein [Umezakia ovalisporum CS-1034]
MGKAVRNDLHGLDISQKELRQLTNLPVKAELIIISNPLGKIARRIINKVKGSEGATVVFISCSIFVFSYLVFDIIIRIFATWVTVPSWSLLIILCLWGGGITQIVLYLLWWKKLKILNHNMTNALEILLKDVDRYNAVIKAIDINDQIEAAGNPGVVIKEREKVIAALKLTRTDLIRALKTERILRENKNFILKNTELFANNLGTLTAMQVTEEATEHGRLLNEALQIALDVQIEMKRLQTQT